MQPLPRRQRRPALSREFADPYVYPGTQVLKNKPGLRNADTLQIFEHEQSAKRAEELNDRPVAGRFDLDHLKAVHKHLFQDVYAWAGEIRSVSISKGVDQFAAPAYLEGFIREQAAELAKRTTLRVSTSAPSSSAWPTTSASSTRPIPFGKATGVRRASSLTSLPARPATS